MLRLCFERLPGYTPIDTSAGFLDWLNLHFDPSEYHNGGYCAVSLGHTWFGNMPTWTIIVRHNDLEILTNLERSGWVMDGYAVHAYVREYGHNEVKIPNDDFRLTRDDALVMARP